MRNTFRNEFICEINTDQGHSKLQIKELFFNGDDNIKTGNYLHFGRKFISVLRIERCFDPHFDRIRS